MMTNSKFHRQSKENVTWYYVEVDKQRGIYIDTCTHNKVHLIDLRIYSYFFLLLNFQFPNPTQNSLLPNFYPKFERNKFLS